jgi:hypothetical protein
MAEGSFKFQLDALGQPELVERVNALPGVVSRRLVASALKRVGHLLKRRVLATVPRDTGALAKSISMASSFEPRRGLAQVRIYTKDVKALGYRLTKKLGARGGRGTQGYPPAAIEFGYVRGGTRSARSFVAEIVDSLGRKRSVRKVERKISGGVRVPALSFMRAPLESSREEGLQMIVEDLREGLEEYAASVAGKDGGS